VGPVAKAAATGANVVSADAIGSLQIGMAQNPGVLVVIMELRNDQ